ncbi:MAG: TatD family hydrolase [Candidatus Moranbacteria bacterium]|nr:TatD family hydrolase [Candidatus Moranbacteria bacterium]
MIDTHAHLDFENFDEDREEVISRAFDNGVKKIVNIGVDLETSQKSIALAEAHENIFAAVGFHPEFFSEQGSVDSEQLKELVKNKKVVAIGEIGLDYFSHTGEIITDMQKENQKKGFLAQIEIAQELNLPVIVHCRNAWGDLYDIISNFSQSSSFPSASSADSSKPSFLKFILHCYSGGKEDTEKFLQFENVYFSFSGNITYPKPVERAERLAEAVRMVPLERIMLDSDSPFLAPQAMRGKRNEPANIRYIPEKIAEIKEISGERVERITDLNAIKFFGI